MDDEWTRWSSEITLEIPLFAKRNARGRTVRWSGHGAVSGTDGRTVEGPKIHIRKDTFIYPWPFLWASRPDREPEWWP